ncbi:MAG: glycosyltransferase [Bacteriovoracales bacterium]|nr:glycosyltransferase [Bacteriovoracales bacterium]
MKLSIIVPTFKRTTLLRKLWSSLAQRMEELDPFDSIEVLFIINGDDEKTKIYLEGLRDKRLVILHCAQKSPAHARNKAVEKARGDWLLFLDDDVRLPKHYLTKALKTLNTHGPDVLGGPEMGYPAESSFQKAYSFCQSHPLVTGHTHHRHHQSGSLRKGDEHELILCHLWIKREIFEEGLRFNDLYYRNEENVLLSELKRGQKKIVYDPKLYVYHFKKDRISKVIQSTFLSGVYRIKSILEFQGLFHPLFLIPPALVLYLVFLSAFAVLSWARLPLGIFVPLLLYGGHVLLTFAHAGIRTKKMSVSLWVLPLVVLIHLSYGLGFLCGLMGNKRRREAGYADKILADNPEGNVLP